VIDDGRDGLSCCVVDVFIARIFVQRSRTASATLGTAWQSRHRQKCQTHE
jgi:hypothetical protein